MLFEHITLFSKWLSIFSTKMEKKREGKKKSFIKLNKGVSCFILVKFLSQKKYYKVYKLSVSLFYSFLLYISLSPIPQFMIIVFMLRSTLMTANNNENYLGRKRGGWKGGYSL